MTVTVTSSWHPKSFTAKERAEERKEREESLAAAVYHAEGNIIWRKDRCYRLAIMASGSVVSLKISNSGIEESEPVEEEPERLPDLVVSENREAGSSRVVAVYHFDGQRPETEIELKDHRLVITDDSTVDLRVLKDRVQVRKPGYAWQDVPLPGAVAT